MSAHLPQNFRIEFCLPTIRTRLAHLEGRPITPPPDVIVDTILDSHFRTSYTAGSAGDKFLRAAPRAAIRLGNGNGVKISPLSWL